ncbi:MAG: hydroxymethylbilane synthase [Alphaproteobacteria bacterium]|nr:hydroxymethylbilane synthase [Alphaproteobacteria bacterium]MBV9692955.1 hydroxymethylbilane synthase [Alphaproteobacteria bacterium]
MPPDVKPLRLGSRGSRLALVQAEMVAKQLGCPVEIVVLKTSGDRIQDRPLADAGGKGLFVKELEDALLGEGIDLAVHSMKDMPVLLPGGLAIAAVLPREDPRDVFVSNAAPSLGTLAHGARVGTSSVRRAAQVKRARPDVETVLLRGNVDTRLARLDAGTMDAMILAHAGLKRLGLESRATELLDVLPALAQGAIGIEVRRGDARATVAVAGLNDGDTDAALACERAFQAALGGSCRSPMAGLATIKGGRLHFRGEVLAPDGSDCVSVEIEAATGDAERAGRDAGLSIRDRAARWLDL